MPWFTVRLLLTEPRACFNVNQLMAFAEESLRAQGLFERLAADWMRIQTVAPLICDRVRDPLEPASRTGWHAEAILDHLRQKGFYRATIWMRRAANQVRMVGGNEHGAALVARADQLEQHAGLGLVLADIGDVVEDEQMILVELGDGAFQRKLASAPPAAAERDRWCA